MSEAIAKRTPRPTKPAAAWEDDALFPADLPHLFRLQHNDAILAMKDGTESRQYPLLDTGCWTSRNISRMASYQPRSRIDREIASIEPVPGF
jgi:hypothetical protein